MPTEVADHFQGKGQPEKRTIPRSSRQPIVLSQLGRKPDYKPNATEQGILDEMHARIDRADHMIINLGGAGGALGDAIVGSAPAITGILSGLEKKGKRGMSVTILIDSNVEGLFDPDAYKARYWPEVDIQFVATPKQNQDFSHLQDAILRSTGRHIVALDFNGTNKGMNIEMETIPDPNGREISMLTNSYHTGVVDYAEHGAERRYADYAEDFLGLPRNTLSGEEIQPSILLTDKDYQRLPELYQQYGLDPKALLVLCGFQASTGGKTYGKWSDVMHALAAHVAQKDSAQHVQFLIACGPNDAKQPVGFSSQDIQRDFGQFTGTNNNANVIVRSGIPLRDLAILASAEARRVMPGDAPIGLANDSALSHVLGASGAEVTVPFVATPRLWPREVWASTPRHHGIIPRQLPSVRDLRVYGERAINIGDPTLINLVDVRDVAATAIATLPKRLQ